MSETTPETAKYNPEVVAEKYQKRPIIVEALQFDGDNLDAIRQWGAPIQQGADGKPSVFNASEGHQDPFDIGHYIVRGVEGEYYRMSASIFNRSFDGLATDPDHPAGKFQKLPAIIEAMQFQGQNLDELREWGAPAQIAADGTASLYCPGEDHTDPLNPEDWVVHDSGEYYRVKATVFAASTDRIG